ncbi:MAG: AbiH family protein [Acinetobacter ursingii]
MNSICKFLNRIEDSFNEFGECNFPIYLLDKDQKKSINEFYISLVDSKNFSILNLINKNLNFGNITDFWIDHKIGEIDKNWFYSSENYEYGISSEKYISYLNQQLEFFIIIFNFYLENIVMQLKSTIKLKLIADEFENLDRIYSFNYTDPYSNFYRFKKDIDFLHGRTGVDQNIVLGISDLNNDYLIKIKAYGFAKYHQKMYKNTDYIFLSEIINHFYYTERQVKILGDEINSYLDNPSLSVDVYFRSMYDAKIRDYGLLKRSFEGVYNIKIWGHSLDQSDENYIKEIFSFNGEFIEQRCDVTIFYFNENAKFDLLSNLLAILGNKLIEKWMKKSWLKFKPNPNIVEINNIQPVDLIKFYEE